MEYKPASKKPLLEDSDSEGEAKKPEKGKDANQKAAPPAPAASAAHKQKQVSPAPPSSPPPLLGDAGRAESRLRKPKEPPPPEAFETLSGTFIVSDGKKRRSIVSVGGDDEGKELPEAARPLPEGPPPEVGDRPPTSSRRLAAGRRFGPPAPQFAPPKPAKNLDSIVPRGIMQVRPNRCVGLTANFGGHQDSRPSSRSSRQSSRNRPSSRQGQTATTGNLYVKWELVLGGGQVAEEEFSTAAQKATKVHRMAGKSPLYKDQTLADWGPPDVPADDNEYDPHTTRFVYVDGCPTVPMPDTLSEADKAKLPPLLFYSVWRESRFMGGDKIVAEGVIPASSFFVLNANKWVDVCFPLYPPGEVGPEGLPQGVEAPAYMLGCVHFMPSKAGILGMTLHDARKLKSGEKFGGGRNDVYVRVQVGDWQGKKPPPHLQPFQRTATIVEGGTDPSFGDQEVLCWIDHYAYCSGLPLVLSCWDENNMMKDTLLGSTKVNLQSMTDDLGQHSDLYQLLDSHGHDAGAVALTRTWYPAGSLAVKVVRARNLHTSDAMWGNDAFCKVLIEGRVRNYTESTGVAMDAGTDPEFQEQFVFDIVDHSEMTLQVWDKDKFTRNDLIGEVTVELNTLFRHGVKDGWVPLKLKGDWGGFEERGELRLECDFMGPPGVAFPQLRPDQVAWGDGERKARLGMSAEAEIGLKAIEEAKQKEIEAERAAALRELSGEDFSDVDIEKAFAQADLDGNLVITAGELRHLLICMGELVTDPEVDEMVAMVDKDGDGGVAFYEFYQLAKTALDKLSKKEWAPAKEGEHRAAVNGPAVKPPPIVIYGPDGKPLQVVDATADAGSRKKAMMRAQDLARKAEKKILCEAVAAMLVLRLPELQRIFRRFTASPAFATGYVNFTELLELFDIDPAPEDPVLQKGLEKWKELYAVFVRPKEKKLNVRELLLAINNFTGATKNQKVNFAFFIFDQDESGELSYPEIVEILRANHLAADEAAVKQKADTIMAAADRDTSGSVSLEEFVVIASRFPNVLFPSFTVASDEAMDALPTVQAARATDEQAQVYIAAK